MNETKNCPICSIEMMHWERYPNLVCERCESRATDAYGRRVKFFNKSLSGGFQAFYDDNDAEYKHQICYIDGIRCYAKEHRFGGIAVEKIAE